MIFKIIKRSLAFLLMGSFFIHKAYGMETTLEEQHERMRTKVHNKVLKEGDSKSLLTWSDLSDINYTDLLQEAINLGNPKVMLYAAKIYEVGYGVEKNEEKAFTFLKHAQHSFAHLAKECTETNPQKALDLLEQSLGSTIFEFPELAKKFKCYEDAVHLYVQLAHMHEVGQGVEKNEKKAEEMYQRAPIFRFPAIVFTIPSL